MTEHVENENPVELEPAVNATQGKVRALLAKMSPLRWAYVGVAVAVVAGLGIAGIVYVQAAGQFDSALEACDLDTSVFSDDDGHTLVLDGEGDEDLSGMAIGDIVCVFDELEMPVGVTAKMEDTSAMDGRQSAEWDDITVTWSYHPDDGLNVVLER